MIPTLIRLAFFLMVQNGISKGDSKDISWVMISQPVTYTEVSFTVRGDEGSITTNCMTDDTYLGVSERTETEQEGTFKIRVQFKGLTPEKLGKIMIRISQQTQVIQVETK